LSAEERLGASCVAAESGGEVSDDEDAEIDGDEEKAVGELGAEKCPLGGDRLAEEGAGAGGMYA